MAPQYKVGETVRYKRVGGPDSYTAESTGTIKDVLTGPGRRASEEDPRYEVENSNTGKLITIYEKNILGKA